MAKRTKYDKIESGINDNNINLSYDQREYIQTLENTIDYLKNEIEKYKNETSNTQKIQKINWYVDIINSAIDTNLLNDSSEIIERVHKLLVQNVSVVESNFYFYDKNNDLKPILSSETSAFLDKYVYHLEEQGIIDWVFEQNSLKAIPNLDETINKQNSIIIYPISKNGKRFGIFLASSVLQPFAFDEDILNTLNNFLKIVVSNLLNIYLSEINDELTAKLNILNDKLLHISLLMSIGEISTIIARELENPIKIINANLDLIERSIGNVHQRAKIIKDKIQHIDYLASIIKNLIDRKQDRELFNIQDLIKETLSILQYQIENKDIKIITSFDKCEIYCEGYRNEIQHVLLNILLNARDAMPNGGSLTVGCYKISDKRVSISIADTGEGIPETEQPNIFEPHFSTKSGTEKLAINLYISKLIINNHKGRITFASELGKGTTFKIVLPIAKSL